MTDLDNKAENKEPRLYHYTNLETLALILKNRTIRFTPLDKLDDPQEKETSDVPNIGRFFYASCWTASKTESIPMWNMYASLDKGVRLSLPLLPFLTRGDYLRFDSAPVPLFVTEDIAGQFDVKVPIPGEAIPTAGLLSCNKVEYTNKSELLYPRLLDRNRGKYYLDKTIFGKYKNLHWQFQKEYRYLVDATYWMTIKTDRPDLEIVERREQMLAGVPLEMPSYIDISLAPDAFDQIEVTFSPKMSVGNRLLALALLEKYPEIIVTNSQLSGLL